MGQQSFISGYGNCKCQRQPQVEMEQIKPMSFQPVSFEFQEFETTEEPMTFETLNEFDFMESFGGNNQNKISQHFLEPQKEAENFGFQA